jgi:hypothetical protein
MLFPAFATGTSDVLLDAATVVGAAARAPTVPAVVTPPRTAKLFLNFSTSLLFC